MSRELLDTADVDNEMIVVLYYLPDNTGTPYVTWLARRETPKNTFWGHYSETLEDAQADFDRRSGWSRNLVKLVERIGGTETDVRTLLDEFKRGR